MMNDLLEIAIDGVISPDYYKVIPGRGMPILNNDPLSPIKLDFNRGNMIVKFDIQFPTNLNEEKKAQLISVLDEIEGIETY
jgi:DnaJ homolog subfamily B member 13